MAAEGTAIHPANIHPHPKKPEMVRANDLAFEVDAATIAGCCQ
jgi:hypothetical protein